MRATTAAKYEDITTSMTRGNQRELAREKALKKQKEQKKGTNVPEGLSFRQKQELYLDYYINWLIDYPILGTPQ